MASKQDILDNLPHGAGIAIADMLDTSKGRVSEVLHGRRRTNSKVNEQIIATAQMMAAMNLWNKKYPLGRLKLYPFKNLGISDQSNSEQRDIKLEERVAILEIKVLKLI
jgi:hypothetical protein